jgi:hypothetical protein
LRQRGLFAHLDDGLVGILSHRDAAEQDQQQREEESAHRASSECVNECVNGHPLFLDLLHVAPCAAEDVMAALRNVSQLEPVRMTGRADAALVQLSAASHTLGRSLFAQQVSTHRF